MRFYTFIKYSLCLVSYLNFFSIFPALADNYSWTGECGGTSWDACCSRGVLKVGNWTHAPMNSCSVQLFPRSSDDAFIDSGTVDINTGRTVNSLSVGTAGTVSDISNLTTYQGFTNHGTYLVDGGNWLNGSGAITNYGLFDFQGITSTPNLNVDSSFTNNGNMDFPNTAYLSIHNSNFENSINGTMYIHPSNNQVIGLFAFAPSKFTNRGFMIIDGTSTTQTPLSLSAVTENYGNVTVNAPFINWSGAYENGSGSFTTKNIGATFTLNGNSKLVLPSGTHLFEDTTITGSGSTKLMSGFMRIRGTNIISTPFEMDTPAGPWLDLESDLTLTNTFTWNDGFIRAASQSYWPTLTLAGNSSIGANTYVYLQGAKIKNLGTWDWRSAYGIFYSDRNGFIPMIENDGTIISDGASLDYEGTGQGSFPWQMPFRNDGLLRILGNNVTDFSGVYLENNNEIRIEGGDLRVDALRNTTNANIYLNGYAVFGGVTFGSGSFSFRDMITAFAGNAITFGLGNSAGRIRGHGQIHGDAFFTNGYIDSFDNNLKLLKFFNSLGLAERSTMILELAGKDDGSAQPPHDIVEAASIRLGGTLDLRPINGFTPQPGDTFSIIRSPNIVGEFNSVKGAAVGSVNSIVLQKTSSGIVARTGTVHSLSAPSQQISITETPRYLTLRAEVGNNGTNFPLSANINGSAQYQSSNSSILSFDIDGKAVPHRNGVVNVTATYQGQQITFPMTVTSNIRKKFSSTISPISKSYMEGPATGESLLSNITRNGAYVVYESEAANLVPNDNNSVKDIFRYNTKTGVNEIVNVTSSGIRGNYESRFPAASENGRYVTYKTKSSNQGLDCLGSGCVMIKDLSQNTLIHASKSLNNGTPNNQVDDYPLSISKDGKQVVFTSKASNLVTGDTNGVSDIFVFNSVNNTTVRVSVSSTLAQANGESAWPQISGSGRFVLFSSKANNLVTGDTNLKWDLFLHDRDPDLNGIFDEGNGTTIRVNTTSSGSQTNEQDSTSIPIGTLTENGNEVVFQSSSSQFISGDTNGKWDIYLKNIVTNSITRLSTGPSNTQLTDSSLRPWISSDGRFISFYSLGNVTATQANGFRQVYVIDRKNSNSKSLISINKDQELGNGESGWNQFPTISDNGALVAFSTQSTNLFTDDISMFSDIVIANRIIPELERFNY